MGIYVTPKNGSIILLGATLEPLCWSRWLGRNSPGFCKSRWHWILSWESWALCYKRHSVQEGTHTHSPILTKSLAIQRLCDKISYVNMCVSMCVWPFCVKQLCLFAFWTFSSELSVFCLFDQQKERTCLFLRISLCILQPPFLLLMHVSIFAAAVCVKL